MIKIQTNTIDLKQDLSASITIHAVSKEPVVLLGKIKSNMNEQVQVKPSHIAMHSDMSISPSKTLMIKYLGKVDDVGRAKLKINWILVKANDVGKYTNLKSSQISKIYKQQLGGNKQRQKFIILNFGLQQPKENTFKEIRFVNQQISKIVQPQQQSQQKIVKKQIIEQQPLKLNNAKELLYTTKQLLIVTLLSLLLGASFGIKIHELITLNI